MQRLRLWTPARWAAAADPWGTRADLARHLAQWLADQSAALEEAPSRQLPVLDTDLLVPDQLAVTGNDLLLAGADDALCQAAVAHLLAHRLDLLAEPAPATMGGDAAVRRGREICGL